MEVVEQLFDAGFRDFGENRVEQFVERQSLIPDTRWHFIGRLSRKNAAKVVGKAELIHSIGSVELLEKIERSCCAAEENMGEAGGIKQRVLLQANTSGEEVKQGFTPGMLREFTREFEPPDYPHVSVEGLMTMAPFVEDKAILRSTFSALRDLKDEVNREHDLGWGHLSMGMSNDYRIALEEGATMVRIGTIIFSHLD